MPIEVPRGLRILGGVCRTRVPFPGRARLRGWLVRAVRGRGYRTTVRLASGPSLQLLLDDWIPSRIFVTGGYDLEAAHGEALLRVVRPTDCVLDIGANIGYYTVLLAVRASRGTVHAFEPVEGTYERLRSNVEANGLRNVVLNRLVASDVRGELAIRVAPGDNTGMSALAVDEEGSGRVERVPSVRIDDYLQERRIVTVDVVKIDVEGGEMRVLRGMRGLLERGSPRVLVEIEAELLGRQGSSSAELFEFMASLGYRACRLANSGWVPTDGVEHEPLVLFQKSPEGGRE